MTTITSAGAGSGIDLESVISASVAAKKAQLQEPITTKKTNAQITLSGLGQLKSAISTFRSTLDDLSDTGAFNKRSVSVTQDSDDPVMSVTTNDGASNGEYNIVVNKLATTSQFKASFDSSTSSIVTADGTLTFKAGDEEFTVDVKKGDTLQQIRKRINNSGDNFGLTANIVNTSDGKAKLVIDSGVSGDGNDLTISGSTDELTTQFGTSGTNMTQTQLAASAKITVDGNEMTSDTNVFDDKIEGLKLTVLRTSDTDTDGNLKSNKLKVTTDTSSITDLVKKFIDGYNTLVTKTTELGKRNTIVAGESQDDGGALAGDSTPRIIRNLMSNAISTPSTNSTVYSTIFQLGIEMDNDGVLSLDSDKFSDALENNYEQVVALFGGDTGVAGQLSSTLKEYTKTGGLLSQRQDQLNTELSYWSQKQADATTQIAKYESSLRTQYGNLDTALAQMNQSASYISLIGS
jgi:Flagellar capping protein